MTNSSDDRHERPADDTVVPDDLHPVSEDATSGEADYVATNPGGIGAERGNPLPEDEQGRGTEYDPTTQGPQREG
jgi:hypothetical protein